MKFSFFNIILSSFLFSLFAESLTIAQVIPDDTLGTESSEVNSINELRYLIEGGAIRGDNLFHSFEEFSIREGTEAYFANPAGIKNIFSRITGKKISEIFGILGLESAANLFLINPNGIVFGKNAAINVGGSFIATTADSIQFEDGVEFAATKAKEQQTLTVSIPLGLQFNESSGTIQVNGSGSPTRNSNILASPVAKGLSVTSGNTLALIGSNIDVSGGILTGVRGKIEVIGVDKGNVDFQLTKNGLDFNYENVENFQNIIFGGQSLINSSDDGVISLTGANIELTDESLILLRNNDSDSLGSINVNASESLIVKGTNADLSASFTSLSTITFGEGNGANINISAKNLLLEGKGSISALTFGKGVSGDININVTNSFEIEGVFQAVNNSSVLAATYGEGNSGNVRVSTKKLIATDGSIISSSSFGTGDGGSVWVTANEIELIGIGSNTIPTGITTNSLNIGKSGDVTIDTSRLSLSEGATVNSTSLSGSGAGNVLINASDSIDVNGQKLNFFSTISSAIVTVNEDIQNTFTISKISSGNSGNVTINTPLLNIANSGSVSVKNERIGEAGTLFINAEKLNLDNTGSVTATSSSGTGGNITINTDDLQINDASRITATAESEGAGGNVNIDTDRLSLFNQSEISATAGGGGNGGNINIDTDEAILDNSNITADAERGTGGNITIDAEGLFVSPDSSITASSRLGIDGTVEINSPEISLRGQLESREVKPIVTEEALANSCLSRRDRRPILTVGGSGALPRSPESNHSGSNFTLTGVQRLPQIPPEATELPNTDSYRAQQPAMIPADTLVETEDGRILLVNAKTRKAMPVFCES